MAEEFQPDWAVHPGETLGETLDEAGMSQSELARRTGTTPKHINEIVNGHALYSAALATRFELVLGGPTAKFWMGLRTNYELALARGAEEI